jgi:hypothetical protein
MITGMRFGDDGGIFYCRIDFKNNKGLSLTALQVNHNYNKSLINSKKATIIYDFEVTDINSGSELYEDLSKIKKVINDIDDAFCDFSKNVSLELPIIIKDIRETHYLSVRNEGIMRKVMDSYSKNNIIWNLNISLIY